MAACTCGLVGDVRRHPDGDVGAAELCRRGLRLLEVEVGDDDARALGGEAGGDGLADAGGGAGDEGDAGGVALRLRHPLQLRLLQRPVLDAELLRLVDRGVGGDRLRAAHDVDRVDVELAGDAGGLLVLAVAEHADAGHEHDRRVGAADRGAVGRRVAVVVRLVVGAVRLVQLPQPGDGVLDRGVGGQIEHQRLDLGAQEVVRAGGAERREPRMLRGGEELEHRGVVGEVADLGLSCEASPRMTGASAAARARRSASGSAP